MNLSDSLQEKVVASFSGTFNTALRMVIGWTYFSAFWRRFVLENKLDPHSAGYVGEKFNHFLPHAIGIKPIIEFLVSSPELLWWFMLIFTITEGLFGLTLMLGLFTRFSSLVTGLLAFGILLGSGWLGTTCLDEWQIGILGISGSFALMLTGGGKLSLDSLIFRKFPDLSSKKWCIYTASGFPANLNSDKLQKFNVYGTIFIVLISLATNQIFHGGIWGKLHNPSISPELEISNIRMVHDTLSFDVFRTEGVDVYGSFLIGIGLYDESNQLVYQLKYDDFKQLPAAAVSNYYTAKVKPGKHSLILPLGAKAILKLAVPELKPGNYLLTLEDISGKNWKASFHKE